MDKFENNENLKISLVIFIVARAILLLLNVVFNMYILVFNINQAPINFILNTAIIIATLILINGNLDKGSKYFINFIAFAFIILSLFVVVLLNEEIRYFYFNVPNTSKALIVEENLDLMTGSSKFYQRKGLIFAKYLNASIYTDDRYRPFSNNHFKLIWLAENKLELHYDFGEGGYKQTLIKLD